MSGKVSYEAGYKDARADALHNLRIAMFDIIEAGESAADRLNELYNKLKTMEMPQDANGKG